MKPKTPAPVPPLDCSRLKALLFDVDGTLADSDDQMVQRLVICAAVDPQALFSARSMQ